jgi:hypothetical protein
MRRLFVIALIAGLLPLFGTAAADACYCGAARHRCGKEKSCSRTKHSCCQTQCCTVAKTCQEVVYEEQERTLYKTVYEEVVDKVVVNAVKYVEDTEYRCCKCTVWQPKQPDACEPVKSCAPAACGPSATCADMEQVEIMRKVPHTVYRCVCEQKTEDRPRVVVKQVPYTVTVCVPKVVCKQVPVDVCAPVPQCCAPNDATY